MKPALKLMPNSPDPTHPQLLKTSKTQMKLSIEGGAGSPSKPSSWGQLVLGPKLGLGLHVWASRWPEGEKGGAANQASSEKIDLLSDTHPGEKCGKYGLECGLSKKQKR